MTEDQIREVFERDTEPYGYNLDRAVCGCCDYKDEETNARWMGFSAAWHYAIKAEREECAKVADEKARKNFTWASENSDRYHAQADWADVIAKAIRARGDK